MALIASTIGAICERGTVASSNIVVGFNLASADSALRRAVRSASASASSLRREHQLHSWNDKR